MLLLGDPVQCSPVTRLRVRKQGFFFFFGIIVLGALRILYKNPQFREIHPDLGEFSLLFQETFSWLGFPARLLTQTTPNPVSSGKSYSGESHLSEQAAHTAVSKTFTHTMKIKDSPL